MPCVHLGRYVRFEREAVQEWIASCRNPGRAIAFVAQPKGMSRGFPRERGRGTTDGGWAVGAPARHLEVAEGLLVAALRNGTRCVVRAVGAYSGACGLGPHTFLARCKDAHAHRARGLIASPGGRCAREETPMPRGACVIRYEGARGVTWKVKYADADGRQVKETIGARGGRRHPQAGRGGASGAARRVERRGWRKPAPITFGEYSADVVRACGGEAEWKPERSRLPATRLGHLDDVFGDCGRGGDPAARRRRVHRRPAQGSSLPRRSTST